mmetsp:Transcript_153954/g.269361  ORF Transcript_153954/g.269361 Transcript_153954/m.269361 type:complete len:247 (-) Transcript_153954:165-905(-)
MLVRALKLVFEHAWQVGGNQSGGHCLFLLDTASSRAFCGLVYCQTCLQAPHPHNVTHAHICWGFRCSEGLDQSQWGRIVQHCQLLLCQNAKPIWARSLAPPTTQTTRHLKLSTKIWWGKQGMGGRMICGFVNGLTSYLHCLLIQTWAQTFTLATACNWLQIAGTHMGLICIILMCMGEWVQGTGLGMAVVLIARGQSCKLCGTLIALQAVPSSCLVTHVFVLRRLGPREGMDMKPRKQSYCAANDV